MGTLTQQGRQKGARGEPRPPLSHPHWELVGKLPLVVMYRPVVFYSPSLKKQTIIGRVNAEDASEHVGDVIKGAGARERAALCVAASFIQTSLHSHFHQNESVKKFLKNWKTNLF